MSRLSRWIDRRYGGPVARYRAETGGMERRVLADSRRQLLAGLEGRVLEIGCGLGADFQHYPAGCDVTAIEPFEPFRLEAQQAAPANVAVIDGDGQDLDSPDGSFDAVVCPIVLCTIPDPAKALREAWRVLRPGGALRLIEHGRQRNPALRALQVLAQPAWMAYDGSGCRMDRDAVRLVASAGFAIERVEAVQLPALWAALVPMKLVWACRAR